jgi:hypothetical protein
MNKNDETDEDNETSWSTKNKHSKEEKRDKKLIRQTGRRVRNGLALGHSEEGKQLRDAARIATTNSHTENEFHDAKNRVHKKKAEDNFSAMKNDPFAGLVETMSDDQQANEGKEEEDLNENE